MTKNNSFYKFELDEEALKKFHEWASSLPLVKGDCCGSRFAFTFVPSGLGTSIVVKCMATGVEIDLTDYEGF